MIMYRRVTTRVGEITDHVWGSLPVLICDQTPQWRTAPCSNLDSYVEQEWASFPTCLFGDDNRENISRWTHHEKDDTVYRVYYFRLKNLYWSTAWSQCLLFCSLQKLTSFCFEYLGLLWSSESMHTNRNTLLRTWRRTWQEWGWWATGTACSLSLCCCWLSPGRPAKRPHPPHLHSHTPAPPPASEAQWLREPRLNSMIDLGPKEITILMMILLIL